MTTMNEVTLEMQEVYKVFSDTRSYESRLDSRMNMLKPLPVDTREHRLLYYVASFAVHNKKDLTSRDTAIRDKAINNLASQALRLYRSDNSLENLPEKKDMVEYTIADDLTDLATINSNPDPKLLEMAKLSMSVRRKTLAEVDNSGNSVLLGSTQSAFNLIIHQLAPSPPLNGTLSTK